MFLKKQFIKQIKEAKLDSIKEYKVLVEQLTKRCNQQKNTIDALTRELQYVKRTC